MPSIYAHYRFGEETLALLPSALQENIRPMSRLYHLGLQGPDILFYYHPLSDHAVNSIGFGTHEKPGLAFFLPALERIRTLSGKEQQASFAYIAGFICHFTLDSQCHPYIERQIAESGIGHLEIETEFERTLMHTDGLDPVSHFVSGYIADQPEDAEIIAPFFPGVTPKQVEKSIHTMQWVHRLLTVPGKVKRTFLYTGLKVIGQYEKLHGLILDPKVNHLCDESSDRLATLYQESLPIAADLILEYHAALTKKIHLNARYSRTFGAE